MSTFVPDASVVIKWFLPEEKRDEAIEILESRPKFVAPEFLKVEFDSVLAKWNRSNRLEISKSREVRELFNELTIYFVSYDLISDLSFEYSSKLPITFYDSLYLVTGILYGCEMITYDKKLAQSVTGSDLESHLRPLSF